jgi:hypothetical protein
MQERLELISLLLIEIGDAKLEQMGAYIQMCID